MRASCRPCARAAAWRLEASRGGAESRQSPERQLRGNAPSALTRPTSRATPPTRAFAAHVRAAQALAGRTSICTHPPTPNRSLLVLGGTPGLGSSARDGRGTPTRGRTCTRRPGRGHAPLGATVLPTVAPRQSHVAARRRYRAPASPCTRGAVEAAARHPGRPTGRGPRGRLGQPRSRVRAAPTSGIVCAHRRRHTHASRRRHHHSF